MKIVPRTRKMRTSDGTMPQVHFQISRQPVMVRNSLGSAGTHSGLKMLTPRM